MPVSDTLAGYAPCVAVIANTHSFRYRVGLGVLPILLTVRLQRMVLGLTYLPGQWPLGPRMRREAVRAASTAFSMSREASAGCSPCARASRGLKVGEEVLIGSRV